MTTHDTAIWDSQQDVRRSRHVVVIECDHVIDLATRRVAITHITAAVPVNLRDRGDAERAIVEATTDLLRTHPDSDIHSLEFGRSVSNHWLEVRDEKFSEVEVLFVALRNAGYE